MKIAYITAQTPYGSGESFILPEILELHRRGHEIKVFPLRPNRDIGPGIERQEVAKLTEFIPLLDFSVLFRAVRLIMKRPGVFLRIIRDVIIYSGSLKKIIKNIVVIPKGLVIGEETKKGNFDHIHAHWASTPSTAAYIASLYSGVPWSFTAHRWDIKESNMMEQKVRKASFARTISINGASNIKSRVDPGLWQKIVTIHMGVILPKVSSLHGSNSEFVIATIGNLLPVKGHKFLIQACSLLRSQGRKFKCLVIGDGPEEVELKRLTDELQLNDIIQFLGRVPHDEVLRLLASGSISAVVHPSILTKDGEEEGIPVALMEAMASGIPVISTTTGGIPELLGNGAGLLVPPQDSVSLANAIQSLMDDSDLWHELSVKGRKKVEKDFSIESVAEELIKLFQAHSHKP